MLCDLSLSISMPVPCLHAGLSIYLSISILYAMEMCNSNLSSLSSCGTCSLCVVLVVVDRAVEPVERVMCLNATIVSLSRHGRDAEHDPFSRVVVVLLLLFA